jgi:3-oxoacid CoA-transferase A subunit
MIDKHIESIDQALDGIADGASVMISGFGGAGLPVNLLRALEATSATNLTLLLNSLRFIETYAPKLFADRRVARVICTAARGRGREPSLYERQIEDGSLALELVPQGTFAERLRAGGAGIAAFYTPTGVGTTLIEGKEVREFDGIPCVLEVGLKADFALMRADTADRWGNVAFRGVQANFGPAMASAARVTVVEVGTFQREALDPAAIDIAGIYTDRIIALPDVR